MSPRKYQGALHKTFEVGVILKGVDGLLEITGAVLLLAVKPEQIQRVVALLTQHELSEDSRDVVARYLSHAAEHLSMGGQRFAFLYLLSHGVLKVLLVWALLKAKLWAYPVALAIFAGFAVYQIYRYTNTHSLGMIVLTILDIFVILLTWAEYSRLRHVNR